MCARAQTPALAVAVFGPDPPPMNQLRPQRPSANLSE